MQASSAQSTSDRRRRLVIPAGQEAVVSRMLNPPSGLDGGWRFQRATIRRDSIDVYYDGPCGERARLVLKDRDDAPPKWQRTGRFALGIATDAERSSAAALYRAVLAAVRASESDFTWQELAYPEAPLADRDSSSSPAAAPRRQEDADDARRARAAEHELDLHLDLAPFVDLGIDFDHRAAFAEALALADRYVAYQSDPSYGVTGWRGLALQALDGDATRIATTDEDAGICEDQSRYRLTDVAKLCPATMSLLERILDFGNCRTVSFLMLEPGARITVHIDGEGPPVMRSVNVALNMPAGCRLVIDCNADGSDNPYTRVAPFRDGNALLMNVAKYHYAVNDSDVPRIHVVARGSLRLPATELLARAEAQDGLAGTGALQEALAEKRRVLGIETAPERTAASEQREKGADLSPFVSTLADAVRDRLLALLDVGNLRLESARVGPDTAGSSDWRGEVEVRLPSGNATTLLIQEARDARPAWFRTARLACSYVAAETDPLADSRDAALLHGLRDRLVRLDPAPPGAPAPAVEELFAALAGYRPFIPIRDEDFRLVFRGASPPVGILWLGFQCNQDCRMCWQGRDWPAPPDEMFDRWLDELCAAGVGSLVLSGGEPTLHPRLPHWLQRAAQAGIQVTLETNAIRFNEPGVLDELREAGLASVVVSLHGADAAVSDALTMTPGTFPLTVAGTRAAMTAGLRVGIHCVVERGNVDKLEAHARFVAGDLDAGSGRISHVTYSFPIAYRRRELYHDALPAFDRLRPRLSAAVRVLRGAGIDVRFLGTSGFPPCAFDDPVSLGALLPETVSEEMRADRTFVEPCSICAVQARCLGVHKAYVAQHGAQGIVPVR